MSWKDSGKSPLELMGLDKDTPPEKVKEMLEAGSKAVVEVEKLKNEMQTNFNGLTEVLKGVNDKLAEGFNREEVVEETPAQKAAREAAAAQQNDPANRAMQVSIQTQAMVVERDVLNNLPYYKLASGKDGPLKAEIDAELKKQHIGARTNPEFVKNVYDVVIGRHINDIQQDTSKKEGKFYLEPGGGSSNPGVSSVKTDDGELTEQEIQYAKKFNITPQQYKDSKSKLVMVR